MIGQAYESYHLGEDGRQHDGDYDDCLICLRASNAELVAAAQRIVRLATSHDALDEEWDAAIDGISAAIAKANGKK